MTKKAIAIVVALVVLVAAGGFGVYYYFTNTPKNKYLLSEKKSYEDVSNYLSERYKDEMALSNKMPNESYKSSITLGAELPETLTSEFGIPTDLIKSSKIELSAAHDPKTVHLNWRLIRQLEIARWMHSFGVQTLNINIYKDQF